MASAEQKHMRGLIYLLVAGLFTGCLQLEQVVTIAANGSGTQSVDLTIPERVLKDLEQRSAARTPSGKTTDMTVLFQRDKVEAELKERGLEMTSHKVSNERRGRRAKVALKFDSLDELRRSSLGSARAEWIFQKGPIKNTILMTLYPQGRGAYQDARRKVAELEKRPNDSMVKSYFEKAKSQLRGLDVSMTVNLPGIVLMAFGKVKQTGPKQVQVRIQATDIKTPRDLILALAPRYQVVFNSIGCKLPLAGTTTKITPKAKAKRPAKVSGRGPGRGPGRGKAEGVTKGATESSGKRK